ncbi:MAG: topoisomerase C-terminal repeat-containing protein [Lachnospiraceae bacterium]|nr:topoisomerase C-terminal repeat-containing protein [Lachnospiraceae bacterium]
MAKKLIITEKPSVARDFARVLKVSGNRNGSIENDEYVITWCVGHLVEMVYPEVYDIKYKSWRLEDLPFLPEKYKYAVIPNVKNQYEVVNSLLHREDIDTVYWAGDSGKEGQTIEENIRNFGGVRSGMTELRVWIDSQTDDEILRGIKEAKPMSDYALLGESGIMRAIEDYSLGINFSRALSVKYGKLINDAAATKTYTAIAIGRVMTCVLGMVVNREREIRNFTETPFYRVNGYFCDINLPAEWRAVNGSKYFESPLLYKENGFKKEEDAKTLINELSDKEAIVDNKEITNSKKKAPLLFNLAELQLECSKRFKISPAETLQVAQNLYEKKFTTYPRTDARVLTKAVAKVISKNLYGLQKYNPTVDFVKNIIANKLFLNLDKTSYVDDSKVTDHYAIIPTGFCDSIQNLSPIEQSVYDLIVRRFLSVFYPPAEYMNIKIQIAVGDERLYSSSKILVKKGYLEVAGIPSKAEKKDDEDEQTVSDEDFVKFAREINPGDKLDVNDYKIKEGKTSPPKRYTSGTLIIAMENAGNLIEDEELREQIKGSGIGTSATRGEILEKLVRIHYLNQNKKTQVITPENLGEMIYEVVSLSVPSLLNPEMTASWEKGLEGIRSGEVETFDYRKKLEDYIRRETNKMVEYDLTKQIATNINQFTGKGSKGYAARKMLGIKCPVCGGELSTTPFGYGCSNYFNEEIKCSFSVGSIAGLDLEEEDFKELIENKKTKVLNGFVSKNKSKFKAALKLVEQEDGKFSVQFDFSDVSPDVLKDVKCPECGGNILVRGYSYSCENNDPAKENPCGFSVSRTIAGKTITEDILKNLITDKKTETLRGFKSKSGKKFDACLVLKKAENQKASVEFDFENVEEKIVEGVTCPDCGGNIVVKSFGYGCSNYDSSKEDSCKFAIGKIAGKNLSESNVKALLKDGHTATIRDFKGKNGKKFDAVLVLYKDEDGKSKIKFDFDNVEAKVIEDVKCPMCGGNIVVTSFGYGCSNYNRDDKENSCRFNIGQVAGVKLKPAQVKELLQKGVTSTISGFKSKKGDKFDAKLTLDKDEEGNVKGLRFVFENTDEEMKDIVCPKCGAPIIKTHIGFRCSKYSKEEEGCSFFVGKVAGVQVPEEQFIKLVKEKKTDLITGFLSSKGLYFDARLKLDEECKVVFDFDQFS